MLKSFESYHMHGVETAVFELNIITSNRVIHDQHKLSILISYTSLKYPR